MNDQLGSRAGSAMVWKTAQLAGVKLIFLARTVILARLLLPEDFGLLAIATIAVDFLLSITNLGMIPALVQRPDPDECHYNTAWTVGLGRALLISTAVFIAAPFIAALFEEPRAAALIQAVALRPVIVATASIRVAELTRELNFRSLTFIYLPEAVLNTIVAIALAPVLGVWALVAGSLAGPIAQVTMSYVLAPHRPRLLLDTASARSLIRFGRWIFLTSLISVSGRAMIQLAISRRLGTADLGLYFLAAKLAFIPAEVSGDVVGSVTFPLIARLHNNVLRVTAVFRAMLTGVATLLFPICGLIIALAPSLVENVLGPRWAGTVPLIQLLALVNVLGLFGDTVVPVLKGMGRPDQQTILEVVQSVLLIGLIWGLADWYGVVGAALAWLAAIGASQFLSAAFLKRLLPKPLAGLSAPLMAITAVSLIGAFLALGVERAVPGLAGLVAAGLLAATAIGLLLWIFDRRFTLGLSENLLRLFPRITSFLRIRVADLS